MRGSPTQHVRDGLRRDPVAFVELVVHILQHRDDRAPAVRLVPRRQALSGRQEIRRRHDHGVGAARLVTSPVGSCTRSEVGC